jgi:hypothetical protein
MMSSPTLRSYGLAIVISGASLLGFWLLGDLMAADSPNAYVRWVLLVLAAVANGALIQFLLKPRVLDAGRSGSWVAIDDIPGLAWFADAEGRITRVNASLGKYLGIANTEGFNCGTSFIRRISTKART